MPRVTALVCSFWPERQANISRIVNDLRAGTRPPDRILVLNNNPDHHLEVDGAEVINSGANFETRGKFVAGLLDAADFYLLHDDDTSVGPQSVECLLRFARRGCCFGYWGVKLTGRSFMGGQIIFPSHITAETPVDAFHGRVMFMAYDALVRMLALEEWVRVGPMLGRWPTEGDDLIAGLANHASVVPMRGAEAFVDLSDGGVAMQHRPGYFDMRDRFCSDVLDALATHGRPSW